MEKTLPACERKLDQATKLTTEPAMRVGEAKVALQAFVEDPESERTDERLSANEKSLNERLHGAGGRPLPEKKAPGARGKWGPAEAEEGGGPRRRTKER